MYTYRTVEFILTNFWPLGGRQVAKKDDLILSFRTQHQYDKSYALKLTCFYVVNYYTWPFYVIYIKDNLTGTPPKYTQGKYSSNNFRFTSGINFRLLLVCFRYKICYRLKVLGFKWVGCGAAGCNYEVTALIIVAMVVKPTIRKGLKYRTIFCGKIWRIFWQNFSGIEFFNQ